PPALTSVRVPAELVANTTVELLTQQIKGEGVGAMLNDVGSELIARESTARRSS
ncbi:MAG TPA: LacI family transcriptional regulator, partial [Pseudomonas sp.]|nr:LacI family transcriptional regulator [Pseudomonas sp.]